MIPIYIPSRGRHDYRYMKERTLKFIPPGWRPKTHLVVREDEEDLYYRALVRLGMDNVKIVVVPKRDKIEGIAKKREWIGQHAREQGQPYFMMMDDDLRFFRRVATNDTKLQYFDDKGLDFGMMMGYVERLLKKDTRLEDGSKVRAFIVGVGLREGNNRHGEGDFEDLTRWNTRLCRAWAVDTEVFLGLKHGRLSGMGDFDVFLQTMRQGYDIASVDYWCHDQDSTQAKGGCSVWRTHETHEASVKALAAMHEGFVTLRQKANKGGGEFGSRLEVTVQWKKARESAGPRQY